MRRQQWPNAPVFATPAGQLPGCLPAGNNNANVIVEQALVAAGMGVTTIPGLSLRTHRAPGIEATPLPDFRRRVYLATYGDPPDPPATTAFIAALHHAVQQTRPGEPPPTRPTAQSHAINR